LSVLGAAAWLLVDPERALAPATNHLHHSEKASIRWSSSRETSADGTTFNRPRSLRGGLRRV